MKAWASRKQNFEIGLCLLTCWNLHCPKVCHFTQWQSGCLYWSASRCLVLELKVQCLHNKRMIYDISLKTDINKVIWHAPVSSNHSVIALVLKILNLQLLLFYDLITSVKLSRLKESCSLSPCWAEDNYMEGKPRQSQRNPLGFARENGFLVSLK